MDLEAVAGGVAGGLALLIAGALFVWGTDARARALGVLAAIEGVVLLDEGLFFWNRVGLAEAGFLGYMVLFAATIVTISYLPGHLTRWSQSPQAHRSIWAIALLAGGFLALAGAGALEGAVFLAFLAWPLYGAAVAATAWTAGRLDRTATFWTTALALRFVVWGSIVFIPSALGWKVTTVTSNGTFIVGYGTEFYWVLIATEVPVLALMALGLLRPGAEPAQEATSAV